MSNAVCFTASGSLCVISGEPHARASRLKFDSHGSAGFILDVAIDDIGNFQYL